MSSLVGLPDRIIQELKFHGLFVPCEDLYSYLVNHHPCEACNWIRSDLFDLEPSDLTFLLEALNGVDDSKLLASSLIGFLDHSEAVVREGAVLGLYGCLDIPEVRARIFDMSDHDPSHAVRTVYWDVLHDSLNENI